MYGVDVYAYIIVRCFLIKQFASNLSITIITKKDQEKEQTNACPKTCTQWSGDLWQCATATGKSEHHPKPCQKGARMLKFPHQCLRFGPEHR